MDLVRSINPWDSSLVGERPVARPEDVDIALARAEAGQVEWARAGAETRSAALFEAASKLEAASDRLIALMVAEVGKPVVESRGEMARTIAIVRYHARAAMSPIGEVIPTQADGRLLQTTRRPRGVVAVITPWNFPLAIPSWKVVPALAAGNSVILKAAPQSIECAAAWSTSFDHLPDGVLTVLFGGADTAQDLMRRDGIQAVSFTGSGRAGRSVIEAAARRGIPVQAEMGGSNPAIVLPDADLASAADDLAYGAMGYAGQKCTATRRVIVHEDVAHGFLGQLTEAVAALGTGDPRRETTVAGPLIGSDAHRAMRAAIDGARSRGATVIATPLPDGAPGTLAAPTVVELREPDDVLAQEELFAPVVSVIRVRDLHQAIRVANSTRFGLAASVHTRGIKAALDVASSIKAGLLKINQPTSGVDLHAGFGGVGESSYGPKEQGPHALDFWTTEHTIAFGHAG